MKQDCPPPSVIATLLKAGFVISSVLWLPCGELPAQSTTLSVNPVTEGVQWNFTAGPGNIEIDWTGGGHLQHFNDSQDWEVVAMRSPHSEVPATTRLFRVLDPWEGERSVVVHVPSTYKADEPLPLIIGLHAYTFSAQILEEWLELLPLVESKRFFYVTPNGTRDAIGARFWNATDACCGIGGTADDESYLEALINGISRKLTLDRRRIYIVGYSNGGFMGYRMACRHADLIAGIASIAGATYNNPGHCVPSEPVHTLQIHGTADFTIGYAGGFISARYPGAKKTHEIWGDYNSHTKRENTQDSAFNFDALIPGKETDVTRMSGGRAATELWTMNLTGHLPVLKLRGNSTELAHRIVDWLLEHPKPQLE
ncbi:MAG: PHB depolymerase family esterase [Akkermansiaceae bacterium]